jgi:hypothetical protein
MEVVKTLRAKSQRLHALLTKYSGKMRVHSLQATGHVVKEGIWLTGFFGLRIEGVS